MEPNIFCHALPADWDNPGEVKLRISEKAKVALSNIPRGEEHIQEGIVAYCKLTRRWWAIRHFPCFVDSFDCCCAAQAQPLTSADDHVEWPAIEFPEIEEEEPEEDEDEAEEPEEDEDEAEEDEE